MRSGDLESRHSTSHDPHTKSVKSVTELKFPSSSRTVSHYFPPPPPACTDLVLRGRLGSMQILTKAKKTTPVPASQKNHNRKKKTWGLWKKMREAVNRKGIAIMVVTYLNVGLGQWVLVRYQTRTNNIVSSITTSRTTYPKGSETLMFNP